MIYTILNILILSINFLILVYAIKKFAEIVEDIMTPGLVKMKEQLASYINSYIDIKMKEFEVKVYRDIAKLVQDQHDAQNNKKISLKK